jgi:hypothetical protein
MANPLDRTWYNTLVDDNGSGTTGTIWNKAAVDALMDTVDAALAPVLANPSSVDFTIDKNMPAIVEHYTGSTTKARILMPVPDMVTLSENMSYPGGNWVRDDPAKTGMFMNMSSGGCSIGTIDAQPPRSFLGVYSDGRVMLEAGARLVFPVTQVPSTDPTSLDDYREGNFTPYWSGNGGQSGQVYQIQEGTYTKIGRLVRCFGRLYLTTVGTISGSTVGIAGLPFPASANMYTPGVGFITSGAFGSSFSQITGTVVAGGTVCNLQYIPAAGASAWSALPPSFIVAGNDASFTIEYHAAN